MASVILLNAIDVPSTTSSLMPDNGLATLAGCLIDAGHHAWICDIGTIDTVRDHLTNSERQSIRQFRHRIATGQMDSQTIRELQELELRLNGCLARVYERVFDNLDLSIRYRHTDLLGIKLWYGPALDAAMQITRRLLRRHPHLHVAVGGPMSALMPEKILTKYPFVESACVGEGEETIVGLAEYCAGSRAISNIPNLMIRDGHNLRLTERRYTDLGAVPAPAYDPDTYPAMEPGQKIPIFFVDDSRGCRRNCPFCGHRKLTGTGRRALSGLQVVSRMEHLRKHSGARAFRLAGSSTPRSLYRDIATQVLDRALDVSYSGFAYVHDWLPGDAELLARSGLVALFTGIESGSESILRSLGKSLRPSVLGEAIRRCMDSGIHVCGSIIFPAPGETPHSEAQTEAFLLDLFQNRSSSSVTIQPAFPQPGSGWWDRFEQVGFSGSRQEILEDLINRRSPRFLPPSLFHPLPYSLDGQSFSALAQRTAALGKRLQQRGVLVGVSDDSMLTALSAGFSVSEFAHRHREAFLSGDADWMSEVATRIRSGKHAKRAYLRSDAENPEPISQSAEACNELQLLRC
jgi:hypothetical protein